MKKMNASRYLSILFSFLALISYAQSPSRPNLKVDVENKPTTYQSVRDMFEVEGKRDGWSVQVNSTTTSGTVLAGTAAQNGIPGYVKYRVLVNLPFTTTQMGRASLILGGKISVTKQASGGYFLDNNPSTSYPNFGFEGPTWSCSAGGEGVVPGGGIIRFGAQLVNASIQTITEPWSGTTAPVVGSTATVEFGYSASVSFIRAADDLNYPAEYIIEIIGDSKLNGTGVTGMNSMVGFRLRNYYAAKGYNVRLRNHSVSGSTAIQHETALTSGRYLEAYKARLVVIDLGTNDVAGGVHPDSTGNRVARIAKYAAAQNPGAKILVFSLTPRNDNTIQEANSTVTSNAIQAKLTTLTNPNILFIPGIRTAWTATDATKYLDGLHPNDSGNLAWWNAIRVFLDANVSTLPKPALN